MRLRLGLRPDLHLGLRLVEWLVCVYRGGHHARLRLRLGLGLDLGSVRRLRLEPKLCDGLVLPYGSRYRLRIRLRLGGRFTFPSC